MVLFALLRCNNRERMWLIHKMKSCSLSQSDMKGMEILFDKYGVVDSTQKKVNYHFKSSVR